MITRLLLTLPARITRRLLAVALLALFTTGEVRAQADTDDDDKKPASTSTLQITPAEIAERAQAAADSTDLDEDTRKQIAELYTRATTQLGQATKAAGDAAAFRARADAEVVKKTLQGVAEELTELQGRVPALDSALQTLTDFEQARAKHDAELAQLRQAEAAARNEVNVRNSRRQQIREMQPQLMQQLQTIRRELDVPPPDGEPPLLTQARRSELITRLLMLEQQVPALEQELAAYEAEASENLVLRQRELAVQRLRFAEEERKLLDERIQTLLSEASRSAVGLAKDDLESASGHPVLERIAAENLAIAEEAQKLTASIAKVDGSLQQTTVLLTQIRNAYQQAQEKVEDVGQTGAVGKLLRKQRADLPGISSYRRSIRDRASTIDTVHFKLLTYDDELEELAHRDPIIAALIEEASPVSTGQEFDLETHIPDLIDRRNEFLGTVVRNYNLYFDRLLEEDAAERELIRTVEDFTGYIDQRVIWIRSGPTLQLSDLTDDDMTRGPWFLPSNWQELTVTIGRDITARPVIAGACVVLLIVMFWLHGRFAQQVTKIGETAGRSSCTELSLTMKTVMFTLLLSATWPLIPSFVGWRLSASGSELFVLRCGTALLFVGGILYPMECLRQSCRRGGLAEVHFGWPAKSCRIIRRNLTWLSIVSAPLLFAGLTLDRSDQSYHTLERLVFIVGMVALAVFFRRALRPFGGVLQEYVSWHKNAWVDRFKHLWYYAGLLAPISLAVLAFVGFDYTARELGWRMHSTLWLILGLVLGKSLLMRLLLLRRRKISFELARERREAARTASQRASGQTDGAESQRPSDWVPGEDSTDLARISDQSIRLVTTGVVTALACGLFVIWSDVLPALRVLDNWSLWTVTTTKTIPGAGTVPVSEPITLSHLLLAVALAVLTFVAARNLPGLLEIVLLERLPLDRSIRYAITMLSSYAIVLVGTVIVFGTLGVGWSKVQWLATALTFGLAFGLQEVFANFVAGLIILFERPLRVGDVVTIDDVTGVVSQIRIRATTITNWDRKEFVVPNKEFITGRLMNWTLSDSINRIVIEIGVGYGSDAAKTRDLILEIVREHPLIMTDPGPSVTFGSFGDSALIFTLRAYLPNMDNRLSTTNELHTRIYDTLNEHGIEIAFPQQDIHIRSLPETLAPVTAT